MLSNESAHITFKAQSGRGWRSPWVSSVNGVHKKQNHGVRCLITATDPSPTNSSTQYEQYTLFIITHIKISFN